MTTREFEANHHADIKTRRLCGRLQGLNNTHEARHWEAEFGMLSAAGTVSIANQGSMAKSVDDALITCQSGAVHEQTTHVEHQVNPDLGK